MRQQSGVSKYKRTKAYFKHLNKGSIAHILRCSQAYAENEKRISNPIVSYEFHADHLSTSGPELVQMKHHERRTWIMNHFLSGNEPAQPSRREGVLPRDPSPLSRMTPPLPTIEVGVRSD